MQKKKALKQKALKQKALKSDLKPKTELACVLVRPIHELNVGASARACANFGTEIRLVNPRCKIGFQTRLYAKHAWPLVKNALVFDGILKAIKGFDFVIATTGVPSRFRSAEFKNCVSAASAALKVKRAGRTGAKRVALVFGPEDSGLAQSEIAACDFCAFIPTSEAYAVMNLSHAVAVMLYEFRRGESEAKEAKEIYAAATPKKRRALERLFAKIVGKTTGVRDKKKVSLAFKRVLARAVVAQDEAQALFAEFGELAKTKKAKSKNKAKKNRK